MAGTIISYVDGQPVYIEVSTESETSRVTRGGDPVKAIGKVEDALDTAKDTILNVARKMITAVRTADQSITPDDFELTFSIKFTAEGQAVIAKATGEASLQVKMIYKHKGSTT